MPSIDGDSRTNVENELSRLRRELEAIIKWDRLFQTTELNADSYLARQRRKWEIVLRIKALEQHSTPLKQCAS
jgi:hypothetical protein